MKNLPNNWTLLESFDQNFIYKRKDPGYLVAIDHTPALSPAYYLGFAQTSGTFTVIGYEHGAYNTHAYTLKQAFQRAKQMMEFVDSTLEKINALEISQPWLNP